MNTQPLQPGVPLVLHVIPTTVARGAQREARALADQLDLPGVRNHRVMSLFESPPEVEADFSLGLRTGEVAASGFDVRAVLPIRRALDRLRPALVVAHGSDPLKYLVPAQAGRARSLAYYAIGTYAGNPAHTMQRLLWRFLMSRAEVVAACGYEVQDECTTLFGVPPERVIMTPNGRDPDRFHPRTEDRVRPGLLVVFVGALTEGKRPGRFIEVVAALRAKGYALRAHLIGDGPLRDSLVGVAADAQVEMLGSRSDVDELLRSADVMVFPSLPAGEGLPGVLIEAGLSGVPVVCTDVPGVRTIVVDGETGLIVPEQDADAMASAVARLLDDEALRRSLGGAARRRCAEQFSIQTASRIWSGLIEPLLP